MKKAIKKVVIAVQTLRENPLDSLGLLFPAASLFIAIIGFVIAYVSFLVNGGYTEQISIIKQEDFVEAFTTGTVYIMYENVIKNSILFLVAGAVIVMITAYFRRENKMKKVLLTVDLAVCAMAGGILAVFIAVDTGKIKLSETHETAIREAVERGELQALKSFLFGIAVVVLVSVIFVLIALLVSQVRWMLFYNVGSCLISFAGLPILLLVLENIIPLALEIVVIFVAGIIVKILLSLVRSDDGNSSAMGEKRKPAEKHNDKRNVKIKKYEGNLKFYRGKGGYGIMTPQADCIYFDGNLHSREYVCTVSDYENGKVEIWLNGRKVENV